MINWASGYNSTRAFLLLSNFSSLSSLCGFASFLARISGSCFAVWGPGSWEGVLLGFGDMGIAGLRLLDFLVCLVDFSTSS